jgi:RNA recognition motif-containing protein
MKNIYVGNLAFSTAESDLEALFGQFGQVDRVHLVRNRDTGESRGFAFVEMTNAEEADKAIEGVNGQDLHGRTLSVNEARPKTEGGAGGGRGFGGGGGGSRPRTGGGGSGFGKKREPRW